MIESYFMGIMIALIGPPKFYHILDLHIFNKSYVVCKESYHYLHRDNTTDTFGELNILYTYIETVLMYTLLTHQYCIQTWGRY